MLRIIYQRVTARGAAHDTEEGEIQDSTVTEGCKHQKVWAALAKLLDAKYRTDNSELPEIKGDSSIRIMGYKRPGDDSWHQWEQDIFAPDDQRSKPETNEEAPMAQGIEFSQPRRTSRQTTGVDPMVPAKHFGGAGAGKNQNRRKTTAGVKSRKNK